MIYVLDGQTYDSAEQLWLRQLSDLRKDQIGIVPLVLSARPEPEAGKKLDYSAELVAGRWIQVWAQVPLSEPELIAIATTRADEIARVVSVDAVIETLSDEDVAVLAFIYPEWVGTKAYALNEKFRYQGVLYKVVQAHTAQPDWTPDTVPALYTKYRDPVAGPQPWVQPTGAQDAYAVGERVTHDNPNQSGAQWVYESNIPANTTEPGRDSTFNRWWLPVSAV